jgi:hypothetical protein
MKKKLTSKFFIFLLAIFSSTSGWALEVDRTELESAGPIESVIFQNYTGPHTKIDTISQIKDIGTSLGAVFSDSPEKSGIAGQRSRYYVIHSVSSEKGKLDADIFFIGSNATVDHIDNLRHIIAAYLSAAYNYSERDAETIAVFVTVYNAVYRGNIDIFKQKYSQDVVGYLTAVDCGLALSYKDWPGKTQIIIPLYDVNGGLSTIDTSIISDKQVVQSMRNDEDKNIENRKNMVDIKEREAQTATDKAQESQKQAVEEQKKLADEKKLLSQKKQEAETAQKDADSAQKEAAAAQQKAEENPDDQQAQQEVQEKKTSAEKKQAEAQTLQNAVAQQETETQKQEAVTQEAKQTAAAEQDKADKKQAEAQTERTEIAKDQQQVIDEAQKNMTVSKVYGMKLTDQKNLLSRMVMMNAETGEEIKESPVTVLRGRVLLSAGDNFIAIAGENSGRGTIKLVLLNVPNMEIVKESTEVVAEDSVLVQKGDAYYCIIKDRNKWVVGKYDKDLKLLLKSPVAVINATPILIDDTGICVTDEQGNSTLLKQSDLTKITTQADKTK